MAITCIAVVGGGTMGNGIAQVAAASGFSVVLRDMDEPAIERAMGNIKKSLSRLVKAGKLTEDASRSAFSRIAPTTDLRQVAGADFVIEAIPERMDLKQAMFRELDAICVPHAILASNTTELSITALAAATRRPSQVIGMHWLNPPPVMQLIEIVRGVQTSAETVATTMALSRDFGKDPIVCKDAQGFITSRAICAFLFECYRIHEEGLATMEDIDKAIRLGFNHPMGPLELTDFIGLDVLVHSAEGLMEAFGDRFRLPQGAIKLFQAGHFGRKTGKGFYDYRQQPTIAARS